MVQWSWIDVRKDESPASVSLPPVLAPLEPMATEVCMSAKAPYMRMWPESCGTPPPPLPRCRTALHRVLMSRRMSSTEPEETLSASSLKRCLLQGLLEAVSQGGVVGSCRPGSLTVISFYGGMESGHVHVILPLYGYVLNHVGLSFCPNFGTSMIMIW